MRIGFVSEYFPPFCVGGAELSAFQLARSLAQQGHFVSVLTPNYGAISEAVEEGIQICRFWFPQRLTLGESAKSRYLENPLFPLYLALQVFLWAKRFRLDVLHAQNTHSVVGTFLAARLLKKRVIVSVRDFAVSDPPPIPKGTYRGWLPFRRFLIEGIHRFNSRLRRVALSHADEVVFVSYFLKMHYLKRGIQFRGPCHVIYNVPPDVNSSSAGLKEIRSQLGLPAGVKIILFGGRRSPGKGIQVLTDVIPKVVQRHPDAHFVLAGRDTDDEVSKVLSQQKGITLLRQLPNQRFLELMRACDLVVSPSIWGEPLSRLLLEAMVLGKPIVATTAGGTPELLEDGETALLVAPGDSGGLAEAICKVLADEHLRKELGEKTMHFLKERLSKEKTVNLFLELYASVNSGNGSARTVHGT